MHASVRYGSADNRDIRKPYNLVKSNKMKRKKRKYREREGGGRKRGRESEIKTANARWDSKELVIRVVSE